MVSRTMIVSAPGAASLRGTLADLGNNSAACDQKCETPGAGTAASHLIEVVDLQ